MFIVVGLRSSQGLLNEMQVTDFPVAFVDSLPGHPTPFPLTLPGRVSREVLASETNDFLQPISSWDPDKEIPSSF